MWEDGLSIEESKDENHIDVVLEMKEWKVRETDALERCRLALNTGRRRRCWWEVETGDVTMCEKGV